VVFSVLAIARLALPPAVVIVWRKEMTSNISMHACHTVIALCALLMHGQTANTGVIAGAVSDRSGALIPRAAVRDLATDARGNFSVQFLTPGNYLPVRAAGFAPVTSKGVQVITASYFTTQ